MTENERDEKRRKLQKSLKLAWMMDGVDFSEEELAKDVDSIPSDELDRPVDASPTIIAYDRAKKRAETESRDFVELVREELKTAELEAAGLVAKRPHD